MLVVREWCLREMGCRDGVKKFIERSLSEGLSWVGEVTYTHQSTFHHHNISMTVCASRCLPSKPSAFLLALVMVMSAYRRAEVADEENSRLVKMDPLIERRLYCTIY